jgi:hypothetical protein
MIRTHIPKEMTRDFAHRRRLHWADYFGLTRKQMWKFIDAAMIIQLERCADDMARRILLGIRQIENAGDTGLGLNLLETSAMPAGEEEAA